MKKLFFGIILLPLVWACETVPYNEAYEVRTANIDTGQNVIAPQNVLIEDFTGHYCGNCPYAAIEAKRLEAIYSGKVFVMGVHVGYFAKPKNLPGLPPNAFKEDFRTSAGDALDAKFKVESAGLPKGLINRSRFGNSSVSILNSTEWESKVNELISLPPIGIKIQLTPEYNISTGSLKVNSLCQFQKPYDGQLKMAMYLTEDSLVNWQNYYFHTPEYVPDYLHMHVLRTDLVASGGEILNIDPTIPVNQSFSTVWNTSVNSKIKVKNAHVIMILYRVDNDEIAQVFKAKVIPN